MRPFVELLGVVPLLLAIGIVVGAVGRDGKAEIRASIGRTIRAFTFAVFALAIGIHVLAAILS